MPEDHSQNDKNNCRCETSQLCRDAWQEITRLIFRGARWCKKILRHLFFVRHYHLSHIILWCIVASSFLLNIFFIFFHLSFCHYLSDIGLKILQSSESTSYNDSYTGNVVNFYQTLVTIQFSVIAVLLGLCFVFTYTVSRKQIRETVQDELKSSYFLRLFSDHFVDSHRVTLDNMITDRFNDNDNFNDILAKIEQIKKSIPKNKNTQTDTSNEEIIKLIQRLDDLESEIENLKEAKQDREDNLPSPNDLS